MKHLGESLSGLSRYAVDILRIPHSLLRTSQSKPEGEISLNFVHSREYLHAGDIVVVNCNYQCNVMLMDDANYRSYRTGARFTYYGGHYTRLPAKITAPCDGWWNVILDLGGRSARIQYNIGVIKLAS